MVPPREYVSVHRPSSKFRSFLHYTAKSASAFATGRVVVFVTFSFPNSFSAGTTMPRTPGVFVPRSSFETFLAVLAHTQKRLFLSSSTVDAAAY